MYKDKKILAIIPARGGSKGLVGKNIKPLCGKPLIGWTIEQASDSNYIDKILVSTDCPEIAETSSKFGIKVPELRPDELSTDTSSSVDVVMYHIETLKDSGSTFDYIVLLEPTSPLRKKGDIDKAIKKAIDNPSADGIISLGEVHMEHPDIIKKISKKGVIAPYFQKEKKINQRQELEKVYFPYGVIYMIKTNIFKEKKAFYTKNIIPYLVERWQNYEIDDIYDFLCIEAILNNKKNKI